jgi:hypothetical protein
MKLLRAILNFLRCFFTVLDGEEDEKGFGPT